jgi:hypothetical protein
MCQLGHRSWEGLNESTVSSVRRRRGKGLWAELKRCLVIPMYKLIAEFLCQAQPVGLPVRWFGARLQIPPESQLVLIVSALQLRRRSQVALALEGVAIIQRKLLEASRVKNSVFGEFLELQRRRDNVSRSIWKRLIQELGLSAIR